MSGTTRTSDPDLPQEVLDRLPALDAEALSLFYEAYFDRIYGFVRRMVGKDHLAEDLTQDIFLHLHKAFASYDSARPLAPWVFTIATNKVRDYWRSRSHKTVQREITIDEEERQHWAVSKLPTPTKDLENKELSEQIAAAVDDLPEGMRTTLILRYFEQMSFEAIGRIVDRNETAVRKRYSRALEELRKRLGGTLGLPGGGCRMTSASDSSFDQELPPELREALDSMTTPDPRPEFRSKLRGEFVAGEIRCSDTMVEAALDQWDAPPAREAFRASCRDAFLSASSAQASPAAERGKLLRFLPLAAAAVVAALLIPELFGNDTSWERLEGGALIVEGETVSEPGDANLERAIHARGGCRVDQGGEKLLMRYGKHLLVEADPGTEFDVDEALSDDTNLSLELTKGAVRVSGKPGHEHRISIRTRDANIVMRGEAIGVDILEERGTCVCCLDGDVEVDPVYAGAENHSVRSGSSIWIPRDSADIKVLEAEIHHRDPLEQLRKSARTYFY